MQSRWPLENANSYRILYNETNFFISLYKSLFFTTNNSMENIYCEYKGHTSNFLNKCLQESLNLDLVMIRRILS